MALPNTLDAEYITISRGDGASPEVFTAICGLTVKNFGAQVNTADRFIRDCDAPTTVPVRKLSLTGRQWQLSGNGLLARESQPLMHASIGVKGINWRYNQAEPAGDLIYGGFWQGAAVLTNINFGASEGDLVNVELTFASDGLWQFFRNSVTLNALRLDPAVVPRGLPVVLDIVGANAGSVITITAGTLPTGLTLNSATRTISGTTTASAGVTNITLTETLAGATGTPRATALTITLI